MQRYIKALRERHTTQNVLQCRYVPRNLLWVRHTLHEGIRLPGNALQTVERSEFEHWVLRSNSPEQAFSPKFPVMAEANGLLQTAGEVQYSHVLQE